MTAANDTSDTDRTAALEWLYQRVMTHVSAMRINRTGPLYEVGHDDWMMRDATQDDAFGWIDDCEARLGCDVAEARAAMTDYMMARDGVAGDPEVVAALCSAVCAAAGRLHAFHPVRRGLHAITEPDRRYR